MRSIISYVVMPLKMELRDEAIPSVGTVKIVLTTYQLVGAMEWALGIQFPEPFSTFLDVLSM